MRLLWNKNSLISCSPQMPAQKHNVWNTLKTKQIHLSMAKTKQIRFGIKRLWLFKKPSKFHRICWRVHCNTWLRFSVQSHPPTPAPAHPLSSPYSGGEKRSRLFNGQQAPTCFSQPRRVPRFNPPGWIHGQPAAPFRSNRKPASHWIDFSKYVGLIPVPNSEGSV